MVEMCYNARIINAIFGTKFLSPTPMAGKKKTEAAEGEVKKLEVGNVVELHLAIGEEIDASVSAVNEDGSYDLSCIVPEERKTYIDVRERDAEVLVRKGVTEGSEVGQFSRKEDEAAA